VGSIKTALSATGEDHSGSTGISVMVTPTHFITANCGDSRAILVRRSGVVALSWDHKPYNEGEQKRIEAAGGTVSMRRVNGDLAVSRALGDFVYKQAHTLPAEAQAVSAEPEVHVESRKADEDEFLVLACDGIWDVFTNEECGAWIRDTVSSGCASLRDLCEELLDEGLKRGSKDNMSVVIVQYPAAPKPTECVVESASCVCACAGWVVMVTFPLQRCHLALEVKQVRCPHYRHDAVTGWKGGLCVYVCLCVCATAAGTTRQC
jgi:protein phosphatase 1B